MTTSLTARFTALVLAAAVVTLSWLPTVTVPLTSDSAAIIANIA